MALDDEHREKIKALFANPEFLNIAGTAKSNDQLQDIVEHRLAAEGVPVEVESARRLPAQLQGGYRVNLTIEGQGGEETFEFGQG